MSGAWVVVRGERYLALETVAESWSLEVGWVREVYDLGLLGEGRVVGRSVVVRPSALDRVAEIRRLERTLGLDLETVALWLTPLED